jgi:hypothetical protein
VLVIDTLGQLGALTGCADAVFVGGSLVPHGGHNPLEAAAWSLPILSGPHTFNFCSIYRDLLEANAAVEVDAETLSAALLDCLGQQADAEQVTAMGERAGAYQSAQQGVWIAVGRLGGPPALIIRYPKRSGAAGGNKKPSNLAMSSGESVPATSFRRRELIM